MYRIKIILTAIAVILLTGSLEAQPDFGSATVKNLHGAMVPFSSLAVKDSVILICFWACSSEASIDELNAINANYERWKLDLHFKMMAICVDEGKSANRVRPTVNMNGWTFEVYTDINGDLQKMLNSNNLPQSMILKNGRVFYRQTGYQPGTENYLYEKIRSISKGLEP
jgi:hypothetical protein